MICFKCRKDLLGKTIHGLHRECFFDWFQVDGETQFSLTAKTAGNSNDPFSHLNSSFFHGKFKKYSARLGKAGYLIKVRQEPFIELPATEFLCNELAKHLGIHVPDFYLLKLEEQTEAFVCKNFMEQHADSNLNHLYKCLGDREFNFENIAKTIYEQTKNELDIDRFIELCLFDSLIGNHDRHGRNLAFIQTPKSILLSPFYDNPSYLAIEEDSLLGAWHEPCGKIYTTHSSEPKMNEYVAEFCRLGHLDLARDFKKRINLIEIKNMIEKSFISLKRQEALFKLINRRHQELEDCLKKL